MIWDRLTEIVGLGKSGLAPAMADLGNMFIMTCLVMAGGLFLIAGIDVPAQLMQRSKRLSMSKQEIKDEHKESEGRSEEHTSELQSLMRISYAVFCLKKKKTHD